MVRWPCPELSYFSPAGHTNFHHCPGSYCIPNRTSITRLARTVLIGLNTVNLAEVCYAYCPGAPELPMGVVNLVLSVSRFVMLHDYMAILIDTYILRYKGGKASRVVLQAYFGSCADALALGR